MDTNLGKRKKKFNKKKQDHDPIIKKVKPQAPQKETEKVVVPREPVEEQEQEEEKLNYDKFMDMFQQKDSRLKSKQAKKQTKVQNRVLLKDAPAGDYTPLEIAKEDKDPFDTHYGYDHQELIENKVNLIQEKNPQSIANNDLIQKDFSYAFEEDEDLEVLNTEQGKVNNQVKLKEYQLKPNLKGPGKVFEDELGEIWVTDAKVEAYTNGENGFIHEPSVHPQFADHVEMEKNDELNALVTVFPVMANYYDLVYTDANEENCLKFRKLWILHVLNHIKKAQEIEAINATTKKEGEEQKEDIETTIEKLHKVRGYTKARASVVLPYKGDAFEVVSLIKEIYTGKGFQKKNPKVEKFLEEYGDEEDMLNDDFKIGLALNEGKLNLYCPFSKADIIITSPLGLRRVIGAEGDKEREYSFLSSIDTFIVERAHVIYMQNWQHMEEIMSVLNRIPRHKDMTNDINEIREYNFENLAKFYRQNIIYTEHKFAELNSLVARHFQNFQGIMMNKCFYDRLIPEDEIEINQEFLKFDVDSFQKEHEYRFDYFKTKVWEKIRFNNDLEKIVLFVSSYFDFLRLRSYFKKINASVTYVSEYTERPKAQSRIAHFINKKQKFLLITERAYYYSVGKLNNFGNIVFYSLPRNASIYRELIFKTDKVKEASTLPRDKARKLTLRIVVKSLFNKYDALALERIVGTDKCKEYIAEYNKGTTFIL